MLNPKEVFVVGYDVDDTIGVFIWWSKKAPRVSRRDITYAAVKFKVKVRVPDVACVYAVSIRRIRACVSEKAKSALSVRSLDMPLPDPFILRTVLKPTILYPTPRLKPLWLASTICPADVLSVRVRASR